MKELCPCCRCGDTDVTVISKRNRYFVRCSFCKLETSRFANKDDAIAKWNQLSRLFDDESDEERLRRQQIFRRAFIRVENRQKQ